MPPISEKARHQEIEQGHSSPRWFSNGVPDRQRRCLESSARVSLEMVACGFLIVCASSSTTMCHSRVSSTAWSRASKGVSGDDHVVGADCLESASSVGAVQHQAAKVRRKALCLRLPVRDQAGRADHQ